MRAPFQPSSPHRPRAGLLAWLALILVWTVSPAQATTYSSTATGNEFIDSSTHTPISAWPGCGDQSGDDSLSAPLDLGFTFNFGGVDYTQVRVHTNGRLQFNNTSCGHGTSVIGPPRTFPFDLPDSSQDRTMRVYGADLDLNGGGTITVATVGTAPARVFVVTWNKVSAWQAGGASNFGAGTAYTVQVQIKESGEFTFMYGNSDDISEPANQPVGPAQIGWQLTSTDFKVVQNGLPAANTGFRFFIPAPVAEYRFEQTTLTGATGEMTDSTGNGLNGTRIHTAKSKTSISSVTGRICRGIDVPASASLTQVDAVDTGLPVLKLNGQGAISFWYRSSAAWVGTDNALLDATTSDGRWFYLAKDKSGRLRLVLTDSSATPLTLTLAPTIDNTIAANTWTHLAITWSLSAVKAQSIAQIYLDGKLYGSQTGTTNGQLHGSLSTLYLGDLRGSASELGAAVDSAAGTLDEVRIYNYAVDATVVQRDMAATRPCSSIDHFSIAHAGTAVTCAATTVKVSAHLADHTTVNDFTGTVDLSTSLGHGDWSLQTGSGAFDNGSSNDGKAVYTFVGADQGLAVFGLRDTAAETLNLNVSHSSVSERSGAASADEDADLSFAASGFVFTANAVPGAIGNQIAGKASSLAPGAQTLALKAVRTSDTTGVCEAALKGTQVVDFAFECVSPGKCSGRSFTIDGGGATSIAGNSAGGVSSYTPVKLEFDATGSAAFNATFDDAGSVRLSSRYALPLADGSASGNFMTGTSNTFAWRPFALDLSVTGNPGATSASGARFLAAGAAFGASVRAVTWNAADDQNGDGIADGMGSGDVNPANNVRLSDNSTTPNFAPTSPITLGATLFLPSGGTHPGLGGSPSASVSGGVATVSGLRYDEVGIIELSAVQSGDYLGMGASATSAIRGLSGAVGRFSPARFTVTANTPAFIDSCSAGAFTYLDQDFVFSTAPVLTITAVNAAGTTTRNYTTGGFFKLGSVLANRQAADAAKRALSLTPGANASLAGAASGTGSATLSLPADTTGDRYRYTRSALIAPFAAAIDLTIPANDLSDSDAVCYDAGADNSCDPFTLNGITGANLRYGRLATDNALGSELLPLATPVRAEYFDGKGFTLNTADVCTSISVKALDLGTGSADDAPGAGETTVDVGGGKSEASIAHSPLAGGLLGLRFSAPGKGNVGELSYRIDLGVAASTWLRYDWDGDGKATEDPRGRASFGLYAGPRSVIYQREVWR